MRPVAGLPILMPLLASCVQIASAQPPASPVRDGFSFDGAFSQAGLVRGIAPSGTVSIHIGGQPLALAPDGRFLLGFDRDHPATAEIVAQRADGTIVRRLLAVASRAWQIEHVDVAPRPNQPSEDFLRIRERELARIGAARVKVTASEGWRRPFRWPATGRISGRFGSQRIYRGEPGSYHSGVDVAPGAGAPVVAPSDGIVVLAGPPQFTLEGNLVIVDHGMGLNSAFLHLASVNVREGQAVKQGQTIGTVGATGRATGAHLHWSVKWNDARLDPQFLAGPMPQG